MRARVSEVFDDSGLTQTEFGERIGLSQGTVQPWFAEGREGSAPDAGSLALIARTFNVSGHWLLTGQPPKEAPGEIASSVGSLPRGLEGSR